MILKKKLHTFTQLHAFRCGSYFTPNSALVESGLYFMISHFIISQTISRGEEACVKNIKSESNSPVKGRPSDWGLFYNRAEGKDHSNPFPLNI